jgi:CDP-diglyceride synthetase
MPEAKKSFSRTGLVIGSLAGALLGAIVSQIFIVAATKDEEVEPPGILAYVQLIIAIIILAKQAGDLVVGRSKKM